MCPELEKKISEDIKNNTNIRNRSTEPNNPTNRVEIIKAFTKHSKECTHQAIIDCTESSKICKLLIEKISPNQTITDVSTLPKIKSNPLNIDILDWSRYKLRHYTSKDPLSFSKKVKSTLTLTIEQELKGAPQAEQDQSGHTNPADWNRIGNVGDTFFCLFFDNKEITGASPDFLKKCHYYIEWDLNQLAGDKNFWASLDWLDQQNGTQNIKAYSGSLQQIIFAYIINNSTGPNIVLAMLQRLLNFPDTTFKNLKNFEIKKHGSMTFNSYYAKNGDKWELKTL